MRPAVGSASRTSSLASVDLPEPVAPTRATDAPGADHGVDVAQRVRRRRGSGTTRPRPGSPAGRPGSGVPAGPGVGDLDRRVEHVEHLAPAGHRRLGLVEDLGELGDRLEEQGDEEEEGDQLAARQPAVGTDDDAGEHDGRHR